MNNLLSLPSHGHVAKYAYKLRKISCLPDEPYFPIMEFLELVLCRIAPDFHLEIGSKKEMGECLGQACLEGRFIRLREDQYFGGWAGEADARFTAAHELGHLVLHTNSAFHRINHKEGTDYHHLLEEQADHFAVSLLVPEHHIRRSDQPDAVARRHGVSRPTARNRIKYVVERQKKKGGARPQPSSSQSLR